MTKAAAIDLAPRKIRVNSVHPGPIDTEMIKVRTPEQNRQRMQLVPMMDLPPTLDHSGLENSASSDSRLAGIAG